MTSARRRWVALLVVGAAAAACTGDDGPSAAPPGGSTVPAPAATLSWTDCPVPAAPGALVRAVAPGGGGASWIAVGQSGGGAAEVRPAVWTSPDGCAWRPAPVRTVTPDGERTGFTAVARRGPLVVALGRSYSKVHGNARPTLWRADRGAPLGEVELPRELFGGENGISVDALAAGPDAFLAAGAYVGRDRNVAVQTWRSTDGAAWTRLPPGPGQVSSRTEQLLPRGLAAGPGGSLVVGTAFQVSGGGRDSFDGAAWYAEGGRDRWQRADVTRAGVTGAGDQRLLTAVPVGAGYVALAAVQSGAEFGLRSVVSADGLDWSPGGPLPLAPGLPGTARPAAALAAVPAGLVAGTAVAGRAVLWRSTDGREWRPEAAPGPDGGAAGEPVLGAGGDRLVLVVQTTAGPRGHLARPGR